MYPHTSVSCRHTAFGDGADRKALIIQ
jgi:hypothetical protein